MVESVVNELVVSMSVVEGKVFCDSLDVADRFNKRPDNVVQAIRNLECSEDFILLNFKEITYSDGRNRSQPKYNMTRDGFTMLVMGFKGKEAAYWKEQYIAAFNLMEKKLTEQPVFNVPTNMLEALQLAAQLEEKRMELEATVETQKAQLAVAERAVSREDARFSTGALGATQPTLTCFFAELYDVPSTRQQQMGVFLGKVCKRHFGGWGVKTEKNSQGYDYKLYHEDVVLKTLEILDDPTHPLFPHKAKTEGVKLRLVK